jgi:transcriptional regulator with XRE-family HTH domain
MGGEVVSGSARQSSAGRRCQGCGAALAADNTARLCGRCHREQRDQLRTPPAHLRDEFFDTDEFRAAFDSHHIGKVFKAYRNHPRHLQLFGKGLNQELLGRWLGLTQAQVSKLENGPSEENLKTLRNYAKILHLPQSMLWFDFPGQTRLARVQHLSLPDLHAISSRNPLAPPALKLATDPSGTTTDDGDPAAVVSRLAEARAHFEQMYRNAGGSVTKARLDPYLSQQMVPVFAGATGDNGVAARRAIGGLIAFAGVCAYDSEDWVSANSNFAQALKIAAASNDHDFYAYVLALMVNQALALEDYKTAESLTSAALQSSVKLAPAPLTVDLQVMRAKALASMGDASAAMAIIQKLESAVDKLPVDNEMVEASYVQGGHLHAGLAEALMSLGDLGAAQRFGQQSLNSEGHARGKVNRLASMASIEVARGEIERASFLACEMVDNARGMESRRLARRFVKLRESLAEASTDVSLDAIDKIDRAITLIQ